MKATIGSTPDEAPDFKTRVDRGLARLYFDRVLTGNHWLSDDNRDSVSRMTHYDNLFPPLQGAELTLGELLAAHPEYLADACDRIIGNQPAMLREEFLTLFLEKFLEKDPNKMLQIARDINALESEKAAQFLRILEEFLVRHQIPAENVLLALGINILQSAHDQNLIHLTRDNLERVINPA